MGAPASSARNKSTTDDECVLIGTKDFFCTDLPFPGSKKIAFSGELLNARAVVSQPARAVLVLLSAEPELAVCKRAPREQLAFVVDGGAVVVADRDIFHVLELESFDLPGNGLALRRKPETVSQDPVSGGSEREDFSVFQENCRGQFGAVDFLDLETLIRKGVDFLRTGD